MKKTLLIIAIFAVIMPFGVNEAFAACWNGGTCNHISQNKIRPNYGCGNYCYNTNSYSQQFYQGGCGSNCYQSVTTGCGNNCYQYSNNYNYNNGCGSYCYGGYNQGCGSYCYQDYGSCGSYCNQHLTNYRPECYYCGRNSYQAQQYYGNYDYQYYASVGYY